MKDLERIHLEPVLVDAKTAAQLCGVARSTWLSWDSAGFCPRRIQIGGRVLWSVDHLKRWAAAQCPDREEFEGKIAKSRECDQIAQSLRKAKKRLSTAEAKAEDAETRMELNRAIVMKASYLKQCIPEMQNPLSGEIKPVPLPLLIVSDSGIPECSAIPRESGVYFVWDEEGIAYIGQSLNLKKRIRNSHEKIFKKDGISWLCYPPEVIGAVERFYIAILNPKRNGQPNEQYRFTSSEVDRRLDLK